MKYIRTAVAAVLLCAVSLAALAQGDLLPMPPYQPIRGMNTPALSPDGKVVCFSYLGDLWTVPAEGGVATRLTIHDAHDWFPRWSPDGRWIAFASNRFAGSTYDVMLIPAGGGEARRITYSTVTVQPTDWSPDGSKILFYSARGSRGFEQCSIDVKNGAVRTLAGEDQFTRYGVYSPDGGSITYDRSGSIGVFWRPRYHGSANMVLYSKNLATGKLARVTDYDGMSLWPNYGPDGKTLYYVTDRLTPGVPNLVRAPASGGPPSLVTRC
jgi:tricorn protease